MKQISKNLYYDDEYFDSMMPEAIIKFFPDENSDYPFYICNNFFSDKRVAELEKKIRMNRSGKIGTGIDPSAQKLDDTVRKTYSFMVNNEIREIYSKKFNLIKKDIENFYNIKIASDEGLQALGYDSGCRFLYHADNSSYFLNNDGMYHWKIELATRVLSVILFLTDYVENITGEQQCKGGDLSFKFILDKDGNNFSFKPVKGTLIAFPSNPYYTHQVNDVTEGYRVSLVEWYNATNSR